jgi:hypothetical protein
VVQSPAKTQAAIEIAAENKPLGSSEVELKAGENHLRLHASIGAAGVGNSARSGRGLGEVRLLKQRCGGPVFALLPGSAGTETHLMRTLEAAQFEVVPRRGKGGGAWKITRWWC